MSSGQLKPHYGFNSVQIRDGYVVRLNKNGTVRSVLGRYGEYGKNTNVAEKRGLDNVSRYSR